MFRKSKKSKEKAYKTELINEFNRIINGGNSNVDEAIKQRNNVRAGSKKLHLNDGELTTNPIFNEDGSLIAQPKKAGDTITIGSLQVETRFLKLEEQGLSESIMSRFTPRLTQKQLLILEAIIHEAVGNVSVAKGRLGNEGELMMRYMKEILSELVTPENLYKIPELNPSELSGTINANPIPTQGHAASAASASNPERSPSLKSQARSIFQAAKGTNSVPDQRSKLHISASNNPAPVKSKKSSPNRSQDPEKRRKHVTRQEREEARALRSEAKAVFNAQSTDTPNLRKK